MCNIMLHAVQQNAIGYATKKVIKIFVESPQESNFANKRRKHHDAMKRNLLFISLLLIAQMQMMGQDTKGQEAKGKIKGFVVNSHFRKAM